MSKPIRVFWSPLSRRFYASRAYKCDAKHPNIFTITGEKFDVTNEIGDIITRESLTFVARPEIEDSTEKAKESA